MQLGNLTTESRNPSSEELDRLSALEIVRLMNAEDACVPEAVARVAGPIAQAIDVIAERLRAGGRLVYIGAGTSGRLGVLDASECPPTFNSPPWQVVGLIAGGSTALTRAVEGAEDHPELAVEDLRRIQLGSGDVLVGIATSGRTPYVIGALKHAREVGAYAIGLSCNADSQLVQVSDLMITPVVGPEVLSGSTRLKAGTATKLILNMLTTGAMVRLGKTFGNLMVDLQATNQKLSDRSRRIVSTLTGISIEDAGAVLEHSGGDVKTAIVMQRRGVSPEVARQMLQQSGGELRSALDAKCVSVQHPGCSEQPGRSVLVLGVDGGGSKTVAWLAPLSGDPEGSAPLGNTAALPSGSRLSGAPAGIGEAGPSNPQSVGWTAALANLDRAVALAFRAAGVSRGRVAAACLAIAGVGRDSDQERLRSWATQQRIAERVIISHDAMSVLAAGTRSGIGIALICGTGSLAFGCDANGNTARAGGLGYLLGDEGSGYDIAREALRAVARRIESSCPETLLERQLLAALGANSRAEFIPAVYRRAEDRGSVALLAPLVLDAAAQGDSDAEVILNAAASQLAGLVITVAKRLKSDVTDLAFGGGLLVHSEPLRQRVVECLCGETWNRFEHLGLVAEPVAGAVLLARRACVSLSQ